ncbi:MAG TPA: transporter [Polyangiaceae bacterium]
MPRARALVVGALFLAMLGVAGRARAQACCSGASAITPARLELHEEFLVGLELRAAWMFGSYDAAADFRKNPPGVAQWDFEQDAFVSVRVLRRGQVGLLAPVLESWRRTPTTGSEFGGGFGDLNVNARYDFIYANELSYAPGVALLLGVTVPTGRAPEAAEKPLGSDATGLGAWQLSAGLGLERSFGDFLLSAAGIVSKRTARDVLGVESELGAELSALLGVAYTVSHDTSVAFFGTYGYEGNAAVDGEEAPDTARRRLRLSLSASHSFLDEWRLQGSLFGDPPIDGVGKNQIASLGGTVTLIRSFL